MNVNKWQEDLVKDIRFGNSDDDIDGVLTHLGFQWASPPFEFTKENHDALQVAINQCKPKAKYFMEIGVARSIHRSSTFTILNNVPEGGIYLGVDIEDKTFIDMPDRGIHTIKTSSDNYDQVISRLNSLGVNSIDFLLLDGYHSINQVLREWEYTRILSDHGVVAFHDTSAHPGPYFFINNLDRNKWTVFSNLCPHDYGFGYCFKNKK